MTSSKPNLKILLQSHFTIASKRHPCFSNKSASNSISDQQPNTHLPTSDFSPQKTELFTSAGGAHSAGEPVLQFFKTGAPKLSYGHIQVMRGCTETIYSELSDIFQIRIFQNISFIQFSHTFCILFPNMKFIFFLFFRQDSHLISQVTNNNTPALVAQALSGNSTYTSKNANFYLRFIQICAFVTEEFNFFKKSVLCIIHGPMKICNVNVNIW